MIVQRKTGEKDDCAKENRIKEWLCKGKQEKRMIVQRITG